MRVPDPSESLSLSLALRIDRLCDRFEADWAGPTRPRIEDYLGDLPDLARPSALRALMDLELALRQDAGEEPTAEEYRGRFPDYAEQVDSAFESTSLAGRSSNPDSDPPTDGSRQAPGDGSELVELRDDRAAGSAPSLRFRILREHARGGLGRVSVALDRELGREVALKEIRLERADDPASRSRFLREAAITGRLEHPGIVPIYTLGRYRNGRPYYAMRFIEGQSLREAIRALHEARQSGTPIDPLGLRRLLRAFVDVCNVVAYAHSRRVVHRDLKPANVMLGPFGETMVVDWGLAKALDDGSDGVEGDERFPEGSPGESVETMADSVLGTPAYMSPEQAAGRIDLVGPASDIYSLGAMLHAILVGRPPVESRLPASTAVSPGTDRGGPPHRHDLAVPRALDAVCRKAMAFRPEDRYDFARGLAEDVERWMADEPVSAYRDPVPVRLGRWARRHRTAVAVASVALVAAVVGLSALVTVQAEARERVEASLESETKARRLADEQSQLALDAIRTYYTDVGEEVLLTQPGMENLRGRLLEAPRRFYETLAANLREAGLDDPDNLAGLAQANSDLAEVTRQVGSPSEALAIASRAREQYERLVREQPDRPEHRKGLAETLELSTILLFRVGRMGEAEDLLRRWLALRRVEADRAGSTVEDRADLVEAYIAIGSNARLFGMVEEAGEALIEAVALGRALVEEVPDASLPRRQLAFALQEWGAVLATRGDIEDGLASLREAVDLYRTRSEDAPEDEKARFELAGALKELALYEFRAGRLERGVDLLRESEPILDRLVEGSPNRNDYLGGLSQLYGNLSVALARLGRADEAARVALRELELTRALAERHPDDMVIQHDYAVTLVNQGARLGMEGDHERAGEVFGRAEAIARRCVAAGGELVRPRLLLGNILTMRATALHKLGRDEECLPLLDEAQRIWERLRTDSPDDRRDLYLLSTSYGLTADVCLALGRPGEAAEAARDRRALWGDRVPDQLVEVAADLSRCAGAAGQDGEPRPAQDRRRDADEAIEALGLAVSLGFDDLRRLRTDPAFDPIRGRPEFALLFDRGFPDDPFAR